MRLTRARRYRNERIALNLASMIDVTFLLLMFFMVTTVLAPPEDLLSPALQTDRAATGGPASDFEVQIVEVVRLDAGPAYRLGSRVLPDRAALAEALRPLPRTGGLFVKVHDRVDVGFAVAAIQVARDLSFEPVTYVPAALDRR